MPKLNLNKNEFLKMSTYLNKINISNQYKNSVKINGCL